MNQVKIGRFIASCRKAAGLTQSALAERMGVSDRAVSKWENGICLPDAGNMPALCQLLGITINDLFSGERIDMNESEVRATENLLALKRENEETTRRLLMSEIVLCVICVAAFLVMTVAAIFISLPSGTSLAFILTHHVRTEELAPAGIALIVAGIAIIVAGGFFSVRIEQKAGYYECAKCRHRYVPSYWQTNLAPHIGRTRYMKCPECGTWSWNRKVIARSEDEEKRDICRQL